MAPELRAASQGGGGEARTGYDVARLVPTNNRKNTISDPKSAGLELKVASRAVNTPLRA